LLLRLEQEMEDRHGRQAEEPIVYIYDPTNKDISFKSLYHGA
jgi:hypothetical protein